MTRLVSVTAEVFLHWVGCAARLFLQIDLFVGEDIDYARRLISWGVQTELLVVPGAYHGFDVIAPEAAPSKAFHANWTAALTKALERGGGS